MCIKQGIKIIRSSVTCLKDEMLHDFYQFVVNSKKMNFNTKNMILNTVMKKEKVFAKFMIGSINNNNNNNNIFNQSKNPNSKTN
jgi:hypothetical protein